MESGDESKGGHQDGDREPSDATEAKDEPKNGDPQRKSDNAAADLNTLRKRRQTEQALNHRRAQHDNNNQSNERPEAFRLVRAETGLRRVGAGIRLT
jgi:hypothetical protein